MSSTDHIRPKWKLVPLVIQALDKASDQKRNGDDEYRELRKLEIKPCSFQESSEGRSL